MTPKHVLQIRNLSRRFEGLVVLDRACLDIECGSCVGLFGENGSGKTSLLNMISGIDQADEGHILFGGNDSTPTDITSWPAWQRARAGVLQCFQSPRIWKNMTVGENVLAAVWDSRHEGSVAGTARWLFSRATRKKADKRCLELLDFVGLADRGGDLASELSFGQMKLVALARVLAAPRRKLLLLDEPTAGISPAVVDQILDLLGEIKTQGIGMLMVEHERSILSDIADCLIELRHGRLIPV